MNHTLDDTMLRHAHQCDLDDIMEIELLSYENPLPRIVVQRLIDDSQFLVCGLARDGWFEVLGFLQYEYVVDLNILATRLAVHPSCRRRGIGSKMIAYLRRNAGGNHADESDEEHYVDFVMRPFDHAIAAELFLASENFTLEKSAAGVHVYRTKKEQI